MVLVKQLFCFLLVNLDLNLVTLLGLFHFSILKIKFTRRFAPLNPSLEFSTLFLSSAFRSSNCRRVISQKVWILSRSSWKKFLSSRSLSNSSLIRPKWSTNCSWVISSAGIPSNMVGVLGPPFFLSPWNKRIKTRKIKFYLTFPPFFPLPFFAILPIRGTENEWLGAKVNKTLTF